MLLLTKKEANLERGSWRRSGTCRGSWPECGKTFYPKRALWNHVDDNHTRTHHSNFCPKTFTKKCTKINDSFAVCSSCGKVMSSKYYFKNQEKKWDWQIMLTAIPCHVRELRPFKLHSDFLPWRRSLDCDPSILAPHTRSLKWLVNSCLAGSQHLKDLGKPDVLIAEWTFSWYQTSSIFLIHEANNLKLIQNLKFCFFCD